MSKVTELKPSNYSPSLMVRDVLPRCDSGEIVHGCFLGIDRDGEARLWVAALNRQQLAYLKSQFEI